MNTQNILARIPKEVCIVAAVILAMIGVASLAFYIPQGRKLEQIRTQITTQQRTLEASVQSVQSLPVMIQQVQALKNRYRDFDRRLPKSQELHEFLRQISGYLGQKELRTASATREEHFNTLPISMKFRSSYLNLAGFLDRVENMERLSRVQKLIINNDDKGDELDVELQMNIYFTES